MTARERIFSFDVPPTARPGDVCKVNLPGGLCVEVTLPEGAVPGSSIEFSAPEPETDSPRSSESALSQQAGSDEPVLCRIFWEGRPQRSQKEADSGLSNAAVERIYAARLPANHPPDELLHVVLTAGGPVLAVPVPVGTKAGSEVLFKAPEDEEDELIEVLIKGRLAKKSPKGIPGAHKWQLRWFELQPDHLAYWELNRIEGAVKKGAVRLSEMVGVRKHQRDALRFDLLLSSGRLFELKAESGSECDEWAKKLQEALLRFASAAGGKSAALGPGEDSSSLADVVRTEEEAAAEAAQEEKEPAKSEATEENEEDDEDVAELQMRSMSIKTRTMSLRSQAVKDAGKAIAGNIEAAPVVVQAQYKSRVQRAKQANAAKRTATSAVAVS